VRPVAVNRVLAELASAIDHASPMRLPRSRGRNDKTRERRRSCMSRDVAQ
jgi:hypothetical protein